VSYFLPIQSAFFEVFIVNITAVRFYEIFNFMFYYTLPS